MTRTQTIDLIRAKLDTLSDDRLEVLAEVAAAPDRPTVYSTLTDAEKAEIDRALDELDRGEVVAGDQMFKELQRRIAAAKTGA